MLKWIPVFHCKLSYSFKTLMAMWFPTWGTGPIRGPKVIEGIHNKGISSGGGVTGQKGWKLRLYDMQVHLRKVVSVWLLFLI